MVEWIPGVLQGTAGNYLTLAINKALKAFWDDHFMSLSKDVKEINLEEFNSKSDCKRFQTFQIKADFESIINVTPNPVVHVLIEDKPSTAWHLVILAVESLLTGEWYISSKGEMAFEGNGGGVAVAERVASICSARKIPIAGWVCKQELSNNLSSGHVLWPQCKNELIPILSYAESDYFAKHIASRFKEIIA